MRSEVSRAARCWRTALLAAAVIMPAACGGSGPGVEGVERVALFERYAGVWVLDTLASDPVPNPAAGGRGRGGRGGGGGDPFDGDTPFGGGGSRGGRGMPPGGPPPGQGGPPGRSGGPGGGNMQAMRSTMALARNRPTRLEFELTDSTFAVVEGVAERLVLPMQGNEVETVVAGSSVKLKVQWHDQMPRLERSVDQGGKVIDTYEVVTADRLVVTRSLEGGPQGGVEIHFAYDRERPR